MREVPLSVYLHWPSPNYENPTTRGNTLLVVNIVFIALVTLSIGIRLYSRMLVKHQSGIDDVMIVLAYIFTIGMTAVVLLANRSYGWNRHMWDVEIGMIEHANIIAFAAKIMFTLASSFTRLSLIFLYYRLVKDTQFRWYAITLHVNLAFNLCVLIAFVLLVVFACIPVQAYWQFPNVIEGQCLDEGAVTLWCGIISCVADLLCTILPIPVVLRLRMPLRQRFGICVLLSAGILVTIAGVIRTYFIWKSLIDTYDETWFTYPLWICAALEIDIAVICACVPAMKTVLWAPFRHWTKTVYSQFTTSYRGTKSYGPSTASQDPIVDRGYYGNNGYQLNAMDLEKSPSLKRKPDVNILERAIAQLPGATHTHHPHHTPYNKPADSANDSGEHTQRLSPAVYNPLPLSQIGISKETSFEVTNTEALPYQLQRPADTAPPGRRPYRPRHQPLMPVHQQNNVTPRAWDEILASRHNAPAGLPPTSPAPETVSQNTTAPLTPMSPTSVYSSDVDSRISSIAPKPKRHGGTFYFG